MMVPFLFVGGLAVFSQSLNVKTFALFCHGVLHVKIMLSYTYMFELVPEDMKSVCATVINAVDGMTMLIIASLMKWVTRDANFVLQVVYVIEGIAVIIFLLIVPESPRWLVSQDKHAESIKVWNYIAKFNGVKKRIPENCVFNLLGQAIIQNKNLHKSTNGMLRVAENESIVNLTS